MASCAVCDRPVADGLGLTDAQTGAAYHPDCAVRRLPQDAAVLALDVFVSIAAPMALLWAA